MIPSLDTYLYKEIKERLSIILPECYIINESLREIDREAREDFIATYCGDKPKKELLVTYTFPQQKEQYDSARFVITLGGSVENRKALGGVQGTYTYQESDYEIEQVTAERSGDRLVFPTSKPVAEYVRSPDISFAESDHVVITDQGVLTCDYAGNENLEGMTFTITYSSRETLDDKSGLLLGYGSVDTVGIVPISTNIDTVRCLDALLKVILITMRENKEEKLDYSLQSLEFGDLQPVIEDGETIVFGRPCTLGYQVTNSVSFDLNRHIKEFIAKRRVKG